MLDGLPEHMLLKLYHYLSSRDLAMLEAVARHFRQGSQAQADRGSVQSPWLTELAAERRVRADAQGWRLEARPDQSWKYVLSLSEGGLLAPLPVVSAGHNHTLVRTTAGRVFAFGKNNAKQLGLGATAEATHYGWNAEENRGACEASPLEVVQLRDHSAASVSAGCQHSVALTQDGSLLTWGCSTLMHGPVNLVNRGLLGHGPVPAEFHVVAAPRRVLGFPSGTRVALVVAGFGHTLCVTALGEVFSWGKGEGLGHGDQTDQHTPRRVEALAEQRVVDVDCDDRISLAVTAAGGLFVWGDFCSWDDAENLLPKRVVFAGGQRIRRASCSMGFHIGAVDTEGVLYTWGAGEYNRLGHGNEEDVDYPRAVAALAGERVATVQCAGWCTAALTEEGHLYTWGGYNPSYNGHYEEGEFPHRVGEDEGAIVREFSCGGQHTVVVMASGEVCTFGLGSSGRLGHGTFGNDGRAVDVDTDPRGWETWELDIVLPRALEGMGA